jgi:hypothetical protein
VRRPLRWQEDSLLSVFVETARRPSWNPQCCCWESLTYVVENKITYKHTEVIPNYLSPNIRATGQGEALHKKLKLGGGQAHGLSDD